MRIRPTQETMLIFGFLRVGLRLIVGHLCGTKTRGVKLMKLSCDIPGNGGRGSHTLHKHHRLRFVSSGDIDPPAVVPCALEHAVRDPHQPTHLHTAALL